MWIKYAFKQHTATSREHNLNSHFKWQMHITQKENSIWKRKIDEKMLHWARPSNERQEWKSMSIVNWICWSEDECMEKENNNKKTIWEFFYNFIQQNILVNRNCWKRLFSLTQHDHCQIWYVVHSPSQYCWFSHN